MCMWGRGGETSHNIFVLSQKVLNKNISYFVEQLYEIKSV